MNDSLYMLRWSDRSYPARYTVTLATSRDCSHITWSRNPASVPLLATSLSSENIRRRMSTESSDFVIRSLLLRLEFVSYIRSRRWIMSRWIVVLKINWWRHCRRWTRILRLIVWYFDFLLNLNSCNSLKVLIFRETSISFDMFVLNNEKYVWLLVNESEWD
jgi:hypothetical protein